MAQATGFTCDREGCGKFEHARSNGSSAELPPGWIMVRPQPTTRSDAVKSAAQTLEYCSDYCAAYVFVTRYEENNGKRFMRSPRKDTES